MLLCAGMIENGYVGKVDHYLNIDVFNLFGKIYLIPNERFMSFHGIEMLKLLSDMSIVQESERVEKE